MGNDPIAIAAALARRFEGLYLRPYLCPAGVPTIGYGATYYEDGQRVRLRGKGAPGERGGHNGDLNITVHVTADPTFARKDDNITVTVPVNFDDVALGGQVKVPLPLGGTKTLKLPPGTSNGRTFRIRGEGAPRKDGTKGDLLATVTVQVPSDLSAEAREAIEQYRKAMSNG